jgi:hypothetical protein
MKTKVRRRSLTQAITTRHPNAFTFILSSSEGRAGTVWVPYNKMLFLPPPRYKVPPPKFSSTLLLSLPTLFFSVSKG